MDYFIAIPIVIWFGAIVAGYFSSRSYKSKRETRIGRFVDCLTHTAFSVIGGLILYPELVSYFNWENMNVFAVILVTATIDEFIRIAKAAEKEKIRQWINNFLKPK